MQKLFKKIKKEDGIAISNVIMLVLIVILLGIMILLLSTNNTQIENSNVRKAEDVHQNKNSVNVTESSTSVNKVNTNSTPEVVVSSTGKANRYFYNQIPKTSQIMYDDLVNHKADLKTGVSAITISTKEEGAEDYFQTAYDAFDLDNPDVFYLETNKISLITKTSTNFFRQSSYEYIIKPHGEDYLIDGLSESIILNAEEKIDAIVNQIVESTSNATTYDKVKYAHDYIINNCEYNTEDNIHNKDMYGVFINKKAVCEGYVKALKYILDKMNIPCLTIYGTGINSEGSQEAHAWNAVMMEDNKWYIIDPTWDDPIIIGSGKIPESSKYVNFLKGASLSSTHIPDGDISGTGQNFTYPEISKEDYKKLSI